jgi:hypothetical protein
VLPHRRTWLLSIGRRLRAEYDAIAEPVRSVGLRSNREASAASLFDFAMKEAWSSLKMLQGQTRLHSPVNRPSA